MTETPLRNLCLKIVDCPHSTPVWTESGAIVLRSSYIKNGRLDLSNPSFTDEHHYEDRVRRAVPTPGDIVITREAPMGEVCMIPQGLRCCLGQRMVLLRPNQQAVDGRYLLYALQSPSVQRQIRINEGTGATVSNMRIPVLEALAIPTPSLPEQRAIASLLGALDDKIELNRKMSATLEATARALFTSWFVDFDPVRVTTEGTRKPLPDEVASLFPNAFSNGVPAGWTVATIGSAFAFTMGQSPVGDTLNQGGTGIAFYQGRSDFGFRYPRHRVFSTGPTRWANPGDTLLSVRAPVGDINVAIERCGIGRGVAALRHKSGSSAYTFYAIESVKTFLDRYNAEGTVFGSVSKDGLASIPIMSPPDEVVLAFEDICSPLEARLKLCECETRTITSLRDALLPKLISGELLVRDAERILEKSA